MTQEEFCDEFMLVDLRDKNNCLKATKDCADVYNLAADMGGMGFIQVRHWWLIGGGYARGLPRKTASATFAVCDMQCESWCAALETD